MRCLDDEAVLSYLHQELSRVQREEVEAHLDTCAACRELVTELTHTSLVGSAGDDDPSSPWLNDYLSPGTTVGRYVVRSKVGEGAMGVVYRADDPELGRAVALKLVRSDAAEDPERQRRLLREARSLAQLSDPHVVPVYDAGMQGQRVYLAMEFVDGLTLRRWLEAQDRAPDEILDVLRRAGQGLAAAHRAGLVHRDFKPDNVLVTTDDRVLVSDFGLVAPQTEPSQSGELSRVPVDGADLPTLTGAAVGTPAYMAPEQLDGDRVGPAADQYAYCVCLVESLTGSRPYEATSLEELRAAMRRGPPSRALAGLPASVRTVVRRGLAADPADRHASMDVLVAALEPGRRRRWIAVAGVAAVAATVVAWPATGKTPCDSLTERADELWTSQDRQTIEDALTRTGVPYSAQAFAAVDGELVRYASTWSAAVTSVCRGADAGAAAPPELACLETCLHRVRATVDVLARADATVAQNALEMVSKLPAIQPCMSSEARARPSDDPAAAAARSLVAEASAELVAGRPDRARAAADDAIAAARGVGAMRLVPEALLVRGQAAAQAGDVQVAKQDLTEAYEMAVTHDASGVAADVATHLVYVLGHDAQQFEEAQSWARHAEATLRRLGDDPIRSGQLSNNIGAMHSAQGDYEAARQKYAAALQLWERSLGPEHHRVALTVGNLGTALNRLGKHDEASAMFERALAIQTAAFGDSHPAVGRTLVNLGNVHVRKLDFATARSHLERAVRLLADALDEGSPLLARARANLANALMQLGELDEAEAQFDKALASYERAFGPDHPPMSSILVGRAGIAQYRGDFEQARADLERAAALTERAHGLDHPELALIAYNLGGVAMFSEEYAEARRQYERAITLWDEHLGPEHPHVALALQDLANALNHLEEFEAALTAVERAEGIGKKAGQDDASRRRSLHARGEALHGLGRFGPAEDALRDALEITTDPIERAAIHFSLARLLWDRRGRRAQAAAAAREARAIFAGAGPGVAPMLDEVDRWLSERSLRTEGRAPSSSRSDPGSR